MLDAFGRNIHYLRISVTDLCNYRCRYCMGEDGVAKCAHADVMPFEEIAAIAAAAARLGVDKIRLTGGEPLVRRGIVSLCRMLRQVPGVRELTMTTNGSLLPQFADGLKAAGVDRLNISLDTLDAERFRRITRGGNLEDVLRGIEAAARAGFTQTKLNVVLLDGFNADEIPAFAALTKEKPLSVRFIERMPIGDAAGWEPERYLAADAVLRAVPELEPIGTDGVARLYRVPGYSGTVGLIPPMSRKFCAACDRVRLTADGKLKPCLHSATEIPLRGLTGDALETALRDAIWAKPASHTMDAAHPSDAVRNMFEIGG
ncbi:MAG: GTP 3',8-cyclase MoaA [Clostridia bacterium]|nr:GTP 3',8-cyclase MoaA [Clostridia bacterium]